MGELNAHHRQLFDSADNVLAHYPPAFSPQTEEPVPLLLACRQELQEAARLAEPDSEAAVLLRAVIQRIGIFIDGDRAQLQEMLQMKQKREDIEHGMTADRKFADPQTFRTELDLVCFDFKNPRSADAWLNARARMLREFENEMNKEHFPTLLPHCSTVIQYGGHALVQKAMEAILERNPRSFEAWVWLGNIAGAQGDTSTCRKAMERARSIKDTPLTYLNRTSHGGILSWWERQKAGRLIERSESDTDKSALHFALARTWQRKGKHDRAIPHLCTANALQGMRADIPALRADIDRIRSTFTLEFYKHVPNGDDSDAPVFIIGMPHSGTSLLEKILEAHRTKSGQQDVWACGEPMYAHTARMLLIQETGKPYPECMAYASPDLMQRIAGSYLSNLRDHVPEAQRSQTKKIVSKYPGDFLNIGHIAALFPQAIFLHIHRNPQDTAISILSSMLSGEVFTNDPENLGMYYRYCYQPMMEHWHTVLPHSIIDISYEDLVTYPHKYVPQLLDFLNLEPSDSCLAHHKSSTFSSTSYRALEPISTSSIGRSKPYEQYLEPFNKHVR